MSARDRSSRSWSSWADADDDGSVMGDWPQWWSHEQWREWEAGSGRSHAETSGLEAESGRSHAEASGPQEHTGGRSRAEAASAPQRCGYADHRSDAPVGNFVTLGAGSSNDGPPIRLSRHGLGGWGWPGIGDRLTARTEAGAPIPYQHGSQQETREGPAGGEPVAWGQGNKNKKQKANT